jgi:hypothetical protein
MTLFKRIQPVSLPKTPVSPISWLVLSKKLSVKMPEIALRRRMSQQSKVT